MYDGLHTYMALYKTHAFEDFLERMEQKEFFAGFTSFFLTFTKKNAKS